MSELTSCSRPWVRFIDATSHRSATWAWHEPQWARSGHWGAPTTWHTGHIQTADGSNRPPDQGAAEESSCVSVNVYDDCFLKTSTYNRYWIIGPPIEVEDVSAVAPGSWWTPWYCGCSAGLKVQEASPRESPHFHLNAHLLTALHGTQAA